MHGSTWPITFEQYCSIILVYLYKKIITSVVAIMVILQNILLLPLAFRCSLSLAGKSYYFFFKPNWIIDDRLTVKSPFEGCIWWEYKEDHYSQILCMIITVTYLPILWWSAGLTQPLGCCKYSTITNSFRIINIDGTMKHKLAILPSC